MAVQSAACAFATALGGQETQVVAESKVVRVARIERIEEYQLEPVARALAMPRVNLLIAAHCPAT